ncbi:UNVERIFIED_CONTAM: hypothetical protein H355_000041, partial [Colinus virginianus]
VPSNPNIMGFCDP